MSWGDVNTGGDESVAGAGAGTGTGAGVKARPGRGLIVDGGYLRPKLAGKVGGPGTAVPITLKLDANEGAFVPDEVLRAVVGSDGAGTLARIYPSAASLEELLARRLGVRGEQLVVTAGADDALDRVVRAACCGEAGANIVLAWPTFEMIERYARNVGAGVKRVAWRGGAYPASDVAAAIDERTRAVFIVSPNNPTGGVATQADVRLVHAAAQGVGAVVCVDHAYVEFADEDLTALACELPGGGCVVTRTLSKAWGMAGLRVGYAVGDERVIAWLRAVGQPYAASGVSLAVAEAWLPRAGEVVQRFVKAVRQNRLVLTEALRRRGYEAGDSQANFVLVRCSGSDGASELVARFAEAGIAVRGYPGVAGLGDSVRITVPAASVDLERVLAVVRGKVVQEQKR